MSKIVKSSIVVEHRPTANGAVLKNNAALPTSSVIKRSAALHPAPKLSTDAYAFAPKSEYLDEMNRLKVQIEESRAELRAIKAEIEATTLPAALAIDELPDIDLTDDDLYANRQREIQDMLRAAENEIRELQAKAALEAKELRDQALQDGYTDGLQSGHAEARDAYIVENQPKADLLREILDRLSEYERTRISSNEQQLVQLVIAVAEKVIGRELAAHPTTVVDMLRELAEENEREEYIRITLSPDLIAVDANVSPSVKELLCGLGAGVTVHTGKYLDPGSCLAETPKGIFDLSVPVQLENLQQTLESCITGPDNAQK